MAMTLDEILESGLLELYVLGQLSEDEIQEVETAIKVYPQLKNEIAEIEKALFKYDQIFKTPAPKNVLQNVLKETSSSSKSKDANGGINWLSILCALMGLSLLTGIFFYNSKTSALEKTINDQKVLIDNCKKEQGQIAQQLRLQNAILDYDSKKLYVSPSDSYKDIELIIHNNPTTQKNYLQIDKLPPLLDNQSFQLWSLKDNVDPIPLDVFDDDVAALLEIQFLEDTNAYAITIEPRGGQQTPTLENLIGIFNVQS